MADREEAIRLAKTDTPAALACARDIREPWYRCQTLGWIARFAPEPDLIPIATEALQAAEAGLDAYQKVAVAAWPIRALVERGALTAAETATQSALARAHGIEHTGSRAEALMHLFAATRPTVQSIWRPVLEALFEIPQAPMHWRLRRAFRDALQQIRREHPDLAAEFQTLISDARTQRQVYGESSQTSEPRPFFW